ncbi:2,3-bisphosphoglycerate-independent phosphoglycerate mutase [Ureaplasma sp. ES3154-GEN]|uniref:2,3-bisphosphoglycerate-independent phosphoglycerate mutase n=1 Tax=Ureaplasma sp. ES3154-GEN TaxID=2984844 RepID=UPI0021E7B072|nr:2,3-bisphosphoglycerate-independent phosphoglycerate mutase [Ureaplasma sp. ES3154-GEN]MCV3743717.1 2,3-bisphosphoglycerate-independent phosphoglycerate mutase [Ureaplasma sp. ES3154-GEN]
MHKKVALVILDGYGIGKNDVSNAIYAAKPLFMDYLRKTYPSLPIHASGLQVGLNKDQFGNSEHGHMCLGAGRVIYSDNNFITKQLKQDNFRHPLLDKIKSEKIHLVGIYSNGEVHGNYQHILMLVKYLNSIKKKVVLHLIADGRDTKPIVLNEHFEELLELVETNNVIIKSVSGRYFAMDRDQRWERVQQAYNAMFVDEQINDLQTIFEKQKSENISDEFMTPTSLTKDTLAPGDTVIITNYRADRILQLIHLLTPQTMFNYTNPHHIPNLNVISISELKQTNLPYLFSQPQITHTLDDVFVQHQIKQARIAETEKYAHVTYFFDAQRKTTNPFKENFHLPSPKVAFYDQAPAMNASALTDTLINNFSNFDIFIINYANADMVGHTGNFDASIKAIQALDDEIKRLFDFFVQKKKQTLMITADHGNADLMIENNQIIKSHTTNLVDFIITDQNVTLNPNPNYSICHVAATLLDYLKLPIPNVMLHSMIKK